MTYSTKALVKDMWAYIKPYKRAFLWGTFLRTTSDLVWLFPAWALSEIITLAGTYKPGDSLELFWTYMITIAIIAVYHFATHDGAKYLIYQVSEATRLDSIKKTIRHLFKLDSDWHEKENSGNKLQKIHKAGESLDQLIRMYVDLFIESVINVIGVSVVLISLGTWMSGIMLVFFASYFILARKLTHKSSSSSLKANHQWEKFEGVLFESVNNISTIRSLGFWKPIMGWLERRSKKLYSAIQNRIFWYRTRSLILNLWRELFRQIILWYVILKVFEGSLELGTISLVMFYFIKISDSAGELSEVSYHFEISRIAMMRLNEILMTAPTAEESGTQSFPKNWQVLELKNLNFAYKDHLILKNLSLSIKRGEKIGIVGLSGAGKSTLFKLLLKLYDRYEGSISFDGKELRDIKRSSYLKHFAYVPQETELFNLSLKENISLRLDEPANEQELKRALEIAHVEDFLSKLPEGVDSQIGEKGIRLSGGERQRVGIARAVYSSPSLLFMDEATSHLDADSELKIRDTLHDFFKHVTAIVIAHRLSTLKEMDRILVLEKGRMVEEGSFESLIQKKGVFYHLWEKQKI